MYRSLAVEIESSKAATINAFKTSGCIAEFEELISTHNISLAVDVGAQFGSCSAVIAKRFPALTVLALEQNENSVALLRTGWLIGPVYVAWPAF